MDGLWLVQGRIRDPTNSGIGKSNDISGMCLTVSRHTGLVTTEPCINQSWQLSLIDLLSVLIYPGEGNDGRQLWAISVVHHSVSLEDALRTAFSPEADNSHPVHAFSVIDVYKVYDTDEECPPIDGGAQRQDRRRRKARGPQSRWCIVRQLIEGVWQGPNRPASMEVTIESSDPPSSADTYTSSPETWHETTACAVALSGISMGHRQLGHRHISLEGVSLLTVAGFLCSSLSCHDDPLCPSTFSPSPEQGHRPPECSIGVDITIGEHDADVGRTIMELFPGVPHGRYYCVDHVGWGGAMQVTFQHRLLSQEEAPSPLPGGAVDTDGCCDAIVLGERACMVSDLAKKMARLKPHGTLSVVASAEQREKIRDRLCACVSGAASGSTRRWSVLELQESRMASLDTPSGSSNDGWVVLVCWPSGGTWGPVRPTASWWQRAVEALDLSALYGRGVSAPSDGQASLPLSIDVFDAQKTRAVLVPSFLTPSEAVAIHSLAGKRVPSSHHALAGAGTDTNPPPPPASHLGREVRSNHNHLWEVLFLQTHAAFSSSLPDILDKIIQTVRRIDKDEGWGLLTAVSGGEGGDMEGYAEGDDLPFSVRVVEYHTQMAPSEALPDTRHYDQDSLITFDILMSRPGEDFSGGDILTLEKTSSKVVDGTGTFEDMDTEVLLTHDLQQFDALCFVSHKYHCVRPLLTGRRVVCVLEFWRGSVFDRCCPHRCLAVRESCALDAMESSDQGHHDAVDRSDSEKKGVLRIPFRLAAVSTVSPAPPSGGHTPTQVVSSDRSVVWGGVLELLWQASIAGEGVDDKGVLLVRPLDETAIHDIEDMFGSSSDDNEP